MAPRPLVLSTPPSLHLGGEASLAILVPTTFPHMVSAFSAASHTASSNLLAASSIPTVTPIPVRHEATASLGLHLGPRTWPWGRLPSRGHYAAHTGCKTALVLALALLANYTTPVGPRYPRESALLYGQPVRCRT